MRSCARQRCSSPRLELDVDALADHVFVTFERAFILTRTLGDPGAMRGQLRQLRHFLELVFGLEATKMASQSP